MKIAIVGTGVAGLVCAHRLHPHHEITVFEADARKRHVFPGGQLVSIGAICAAFARAGELQPTRLEDITAHNAETHQGKCLYKI